MPMRNCMIHGFDNVMGTRMNGREHGSKDTIQRGLEGAKKLLEDYQEPKLDQAKDEELLDYIAKRETTIPLKVLHCMLMTQVMTTRTYIPNCS